MESCDTKHEMSAFERRFRKYEEQKEGGFKIANILQGLENFNLNDRSIKSDPKFVIRSLDEQDYKRYRKFYAKEPRKTIDEPDVYGRPALHWKVGSHSLAAIRHLLAGKADINSTTLFEGFTPLMVACRVGGDLRVFKELLIRGADVNKRAHSGASAFHIATASSSRDCMKLLITHGGDPNLLTNDGSHALDFTKDEKTRKVVHTCCRSWFVFADRAAAHCASCEAKAFQLKRCALCYVTFYCDHECQLKHWKMEHRDKCPGHVIAKIVANEQGEDLGDRFTAVDVNTHDRKTFIVEAYPAVAVVANSPQEIIKVVNVVKHIEATITPLHDEDEDFWRLLDYVVCNGEGGKQAVHFWAKFKDQTKEELMVYHGGKVPRAGAWVATEMRRRQMEMFKKQIGQDLPGSVICVR